MHSGGCKRWDRIIERGRNESGEMNPEVSYCDSTKWVLKKRLERIGDKNIVKERYDFGEKDVAGIEIVSFVSIFSNYCQVQCIMVQYSMVCMTI